VTILACLLAAVASDVALARARTKACSSASSCSVVLITPPAVTAPPPGPTAPPPAPISSRFSVGVSPAITSSSGAANQPAKLVAGPVAAKVNCSGYQPRDARPFEFKLLTATPLTITYTIADRIKNTTAAGVHFCLAAPFAFKTLSGQPAPSVTLPDGTSGHAGLLPPCARPLPPPGATTAPCVVATQTVHDASSSTNVDVIVRVRVPTTTKGGDPWGHS
jgi:hypothetical protein